MKEEAFNELIESIREGGRIMRGLAKPSRTFRLQEPRISLLRRRFKLSQSGFAAMMGISVGTLRNWEQGRRRPRGPARVLLSVVAKHPDAILDTIGKTNSR